MDLNFHPAVKCPHCGGTNRPAISGQGGQFNTRTKYCKHCEKDYTLVVYVEATTEVDATLQVSGLRSRISHYRERIYELRNKLTNKAAEFAEEYVMVEASTRGRQN